MHDYATHISRASGGMTPSIVVEVFTIPASCLEGHKASHILQNHILTEVVLCSVQLLQTVARTEP